MGSLSDNGNKNQSLGNSGQWTGGSFKGYAFKQQQEWDSRSALARIYDISKTDQERAKKLYSDYKYLQNDPTSKYYRKYANPTNQAVYNLQSMGFDTSILTDDWFNTNNGWIMNNLEYRSGSTNTPSAPTKKSTADQRLAYELYQYQKSEAQTKQAEKEYRDAIKEAQYWALRDDRNYSDEQIIEKVRKNFSKKYKTLSDMENSTFSPLELNRSVDFSDDVLYGAIWQARNSDEATKYGYNLEQCMAFSYLGKGKTWEENQKIANQLNPESPDYLPYATGSTNLDDAAMHFGVKYFNSDWAKNHTYILNSGSDEDIKFFRQVQQAEENTRAAEKAVETLATWIEKNLYNATDPDKAKEKFEKLYKKGKITIRTENGREEVDLSILKKMDQSMGMNGEPGTTDLVSMTRGINYKYDNVMGMIDAICELNNSNPVSDGSKYIDYTQSQWFGNDNPRVSTVIRQAQDEKLNGYADVYDLGGTESEHDYVETSWSSSYDDVKTNTEEVADWSAEQANAIKMIQSEMLGAQKDYANTTMGNFQTVYDYDQTKRTRDALQEELDKIAPEIEAKIPETQSEAKHTDEIEVDGNKYKVTLAYNHNVGYYLESATDMSGNPIGGDVFIDPEVNELVNRYNFEAQQYETNKKEDYSLTPEEREKYNTYKSLQLQIQDCDKYIAEHEKEYEDSSKALKEANEKFDQQYYMMQKYGMSTTDLDVENAVLTYLTGFKDYEATEWSTYNPSDYFRQALASGSDRETVYAAAEQGRQQMLMELEDAKSVKQYLKELNANIPNDYINNLDRHIAKLERDIKDYEYFALSKESDFKEMAEKGRQEEFNNRPILWTPFKKIAEYDWDYNEYYNQLSNFDGNYESIWAGYGLRGTAGPYTRYLTEDEKDIYYYLMGKGEKEKAKDYISSLTDMSYGVAQARGTEEIRENSRNAFRQTKTEDFKTEDEANKWIADNGDKEYQITNDENGYHVSWTEDNGFGSFLGQNVLAVLSAPVSSLMSLGYGAYSKISGRELNPNNVMLAFNNFRTSTREESAKSIANYCGEGTLKQKAVQMFYEMVSNRLDSLMQGATFGGGEIFSGSGILARSANEIFGASSMGISAAMDTMMRAKEKGASDGQMWTLGLVTYVSETATEAIEIGHIKDSFSKDTLKTFFKDWFTKAGLSEALGESINDIAENFADRFVMRDKSEHADLVWQYRMEGHDPDEAEALANRDEALGVMRTAVMSYLSPGLDIVSYGAGRASNYINNVSSRKKADKSQRISQIIKDLHTENQEAKEKAKEEKAKEEEKETERQEWLSQDTANGEGALNLDLLDLQKEGIPLTPENLAELEKYRQMQEENAAKGKTRDSEDIMADWEILETARKSDTPTQTASIAAILNDNRTELSSDEAKAAATNIGKALKGKNVITWLQNLFTGASVDNINSAEVKQGIRYAALGGEQSASYQMIQSEEFQNATPNQQARMLAVTGYTDAQNEAVQKVYNRNVFENRVNEAQKILQATDPEFQKEMDAAQEMEESAAEQRVVVLELQLQQEQKYEAAKAASDRYTAATMEYLANPTDANKHAMDTARDQYLSADTRATDANNLNKAQAKLDELEAAAKKTREEALTKVRQAAVDLVNQTDRQRADAEAQRQADEKAAQEALDNQKAIVDNIFKQAKELNNFTRLNAEDFVDQNFPNISEEDRSHAIGMTMALQKAMSHNFDSANARREFSKNFTKRFNLNYQEVEGGEIYGANARIDPSTKTLLVNKNATQLDIMYAVLGHEITHLAEASKTYTELADMALQIRYGDGVTWDDTLAKIKANDQTSKIVQDFLRVKKTYDESTATKSNDHTAEQILQEIVADSVGSIISGDDAAIQRLVQKPNLARRVIEAIKSFIRKAKGLEGEPLTQAQMVVDKLVAELNKANNQPGQTRNSLDYYKNNVLARDQDYFENIFQYQPTINITEIATPSPVVTNSNGAVDINSVLAVARNSPYVQTVSFNGSSPRYYTFVPDLGINVELNGEGLKHDFGKAGNRNHVDNALVTQYIGEILQNAIEVNRGKAHPNETNYEHVLVGGIRLGKGGNATDYAVRITIHNKEGNQAQLDSLEVIGRLYSIKEKKTMLVSYQGNNAKGAGNTSSSMSLSDFFDDVKTDMNDGPFAAAVYQNHKSGIPRQKTRYSDNLRYSLPSEGVAVPAVIDDNGETLTETLDNDTQVKYSLSSWTEQEIAKVRKNLLKNGFTEEEANKWIDDVNSIAAIIAADKDRLDFIPDRDQKFKKPNGDVYKWTLDASTLCAKRLLYQGTFNEIQKRLPNVPLRPGDLIELANMMHEMGYQTPCGICYVESRRRHLGNFTEEFLADYKGEYKPTYAELTSTDGLARLKQEHRQAYDDYIAAMNGKGVASPKVVQLRTDYRGDVRSLNKDSIAYLNSIGGLRIQSFSDFETPHLMDMMQAVIDMAAVKLKSQAYTKVPNFAWAFGDTGIKINLSMMGDGNGITLSNGLTFADIASMPYEQAKELVRLAYSDTEGMKYDEAMKLRNRYSQNVGTILVGMNDEHIIVAMGDDEVDYIIPFHKSGWSQEELDKMKALENYQDYQDTQNELWIVGQNKDGSYIVKSIDKKTGNLDPYGDDGYWEYDHDGQWNAEKYLRLCAEQKRLPKFSQFLVDNGDGTFSLPQGDDYRSTAIRKGYWKTLIDFKMYDNDGNGAEQTAVTPNINMPEAYRILNEYEAPEGGNNALPKADPVVDAYVEWYNKTHAAEDNTQWKASLPDDFQKEVDDWFEQYISGMSAEELDQLSQEMFGISLNTPTMAENTEAPVVETKEPEQFIENAREVYINAVNSGDMETARKVIDQIAKAAGYTVRGTHRTNENFTVFERSKQTKKNGATLGDGFYVAAGEGTEYDNATYGKNRMLVYINPGNVFDIQKGGLSEAEAREVYAKYFAPLHKLANDAYDDDNPYTAHVVSQLQKSYKVMDYIKEAAEKNGVTTDVIFKELGYNSIKDGPQYCVFDNTQIKSADPITYNDQGEMIDMDERFNADEQDYRYSLPDGTTAIAAYIPNGVKENGDEVDFIDAMFNGSKKYETRQTRNLRLDDEGWVGVTRGGKNGEVVGRIRFGEPVRFQRYDENGNETQIYKDSLIKGTQRYDMEEGDTKWAYPVLEVEDFRDNPRPVLKNLPSNAQYRYSLPSDAPYLSAVNHGDMGEAQRLVDERAKEAGYNYKAFHGTTRQFNAFRFTSDDLGIHLGTKGQARMMAGRGKDARVIEAYVKLENPIRFERDLGAWEGKRVAKELYDMGIITEQEAADALLSPDRTYRLSDEKSTKNIRDLLISKGYDGFVYDNDFEGYSKKSQQSIAVFNPNQIKVADPVTYDNQGNVIPLGERFQTEKQDIRYSLPSDDVLQQQILDYLNNNNTPVNNEGFSGPMEGQNPNMSSDKGPNQRGFGQGMLKSNDEIDQEVKDYVMKRNAYFPDTNAEQIERAIKWIRSNKKTAESDGFDESFQAVTSKNFNYMSADGQARMIAVMGMAVSKGNVVAQAELNDAFNRQGTDLGRAFQARKLYRLMTPEGRKQSLENMMNRVQADLDAKGIRTELKFSHWIYDLAAVAESEADFRQLQRIAANEIAQQIPANWKDRFRSFRMLAMLGNPRTHIRNIVGNAVFVPIVGVKNKIGALLELKKPQGQKTKTLSLRLDDAIRQFAWADAEKMKDVLTGEAKYNENNLVNQEMKAFKGLLQAVIDFNSNKLEAEDWYFLKRHYTRAFGGWMQANGYTEQQLKDNPSLLEQGRAYATLEAQKATYRDFNEFAKRLNDFVRNPKTLEGKAGALLVEAVLPFKKTPANILRRGLEYSPVGLIKSLTYDLHALHKYNEAIEAGVTTIPDDAITPNQWIDKVSSGLTGTGIMMLGALLSSMGLITCSLGDDDDPEKEKGGQKYSIKILGTDLTYTIDWAAPGCIPLFVGAALMEEHEDMNWSDLANAITGITEPVFNLSMLDGLSSVFKTSSYGDKTDPLTQVGLKIATNYISSYWPSIFGATSRTFFDDTRRKSFVPSDKGQGPAGTIAYAWEGLKNKTPFSTQSIPVRDIWGNAETSGFVERLFENFVSPGYINETKNDPILNEMARLYDTHVEGSDGLVPGNPKKTYTYKNQKYVFSDKEWDEYYVTRGQTAFNLLNSLLNNKDYLNADDATRVQMIKSCWSYADKVGLSKVIPNYEYDQLSVASIAEEGKKNNYKTHMMTSLDTQDWTGYDTMLQGLQDMGVDDSTIKTWIGNKYRDQYKSAYRKGDNAEMSRIENLLDNSGFDFDIDAWEEQVDNKYGY